MPLGRKVSLTILNIYPLENRRSSPEVFLNQITIQETGLSFESMDVTSDVSTVHETGETLVNNNNDLLEEPVENPHQLKSTESSFITSVKKIVGNKYENNLHF